MDFDYSVLLERGREKLPEKSEGEDRFEVPKVRGHIQGNRTVINNFHQIAHALNRPPEHVVKYVLKELATPGELTKTALIIGTKTPASRVNEKIVQYVRDFVTCTECTKPDTKLVKDGNIISMKCNACGAKHVVLAK